MVSLNSLEEVLVRLKIKQSMQTSSTACLTCPGMDPVPARLRKLMVAGTLGSPKVPFMRWRCDSVYKAYSVSQVPSCRHVNSSAFEVLPFIFQI